MLCVNTMIRTGRENLGHSLRALSPPIHQLLHRLVGRLSPFLAVSGAEYRLTQLDESLAAYPVKYTRSNSSEVLEGRLADLASDYDAKLMLSSVLALYYITAIATTDIFISMGQAPRQI